MDNKNTNKRTDTPVNKTIVSEEKYEELCGQDRLNLLYLDILKQFKWFIDYQVRGLWSSFSNATNIIDNSQKSDDMATSVHDTSVIIIDYVKL